ncbi:MAG TPA: YhfC family intramembrane metalloprotease, partial [Caldilineae bacterium]|nr:YhfC family intramembrane metalloprotease [Caldilineae bacterium]
LLFTYPLNALLMILIPILLGIFLAKKYGLSWRLFIFGAAAFILAQFFHLPLNAVLTRIIPGQGGADPNLMLQAVIFAATAAFTEELARYSVLRNKLKDARGWKEALMYGAGHGGIEAIILGAVAFASFAGMIALKNNPDQLAGLEPDQLALAQQQLTAYWSAAWYESLMGAVERGFALTIQIALAVMVMQVFLRENKNWLWAAMGWHWLVNAVSVWSLGHFQNILITELIVGVFALTSLMIILFFRPVSHEAVVTSDLGNADDAEGDG